MMEPALLLTFLLVADFESVVSLTSKVIPTSIMVAHCVSTFHLPPMRQSRPGVCHKLLLEILIYTVEHSE